MSIGAIDNMEKKIRRPNWSKGDVMILGIISDTHGLLRPLALEALRPCELILHAGDVGNPEILNDLMDIAPTVTVRGNVDRDDWANVLPKTEVVEAVG